MCVKKQSYYCAKKSMGLLIFQSLDCKESSNFNLNKSSTHLKKGGLLLSFSSSVTDQAVMTDAKLDSGRRRVTHTADCLVEALAME